MTLYAYLTKTADVATGEQPPRPAMTLPPSVRTGFTPRPHQENAIRRLFENQGRMLMAHDTGTGKTLTSIVGSEMLREKGGGTVLVVAPSGLRKNYADAVKQFTTRRTHVANGPDDIDPGADYNVVSYEALRSDPDGVMQRSGATTLILDEFHRARNDRTSTYAALWRARQHAKHFMGLTASPINNHPDELAALLSLSENNPNLTKADFRRKFVRQVGETTGFTGTQRPLYGIRDPAQFVKSVYPKMDVVGTEDIPGNDMPRKDTKNVYVPMSPEQWRLYQLSLKRLGPVAEYITRRDKNVSVKDAEMVFTQIAQARQIANSLHRGRADVTPEASALRTPKVNKLLSDAEAHLNERPDNQAVLYTNLINGGVDVLSAGLKARGIPHALFIGKGTEVGDSRVTEAVRQQGVADYKAGKKRVIVVSGAGAEGLDLKDSTAFFALDGHFNPQRVLQAEARARRLGGLAARPPQERVVDVRRYQSVAPGGNQPGLLARLVGRKPDRTTDEWTYQVAAAKAGMGKQFSTALRSAPSYIRKEPVVRQDGSPGVRYVYNTPAQPTFFQRVLGAQPPKLETP